MNSIIRHANKFLSKEIKAFKKIVIDAGEVSHETFDGLIKKNPILLFYPNTSNIKAVGALKAPNNTYKRKVFRKSKSLLDPNKFEYELGWIVCLKPGNGIGQKITMELSNYKNNVYATVREENEKMKHILEKFDFIQSGDSFDSDRGDYKVNLFVKHE